MDMLESARRVLQEAEAKLRGLVSEGVLGAVLTALAVLLFLRSVRSALIVAGWSAYPRQRKSFELLGDLFCEQENYTKALMMYDRALSLESAPGIKVTGRAFGFGRRMPIAQRYDASRSIARAPKPANG